MKHRYIIKALSKDVQGYKDTLARYAVRTNVLVAKWSKRLDNAVHDDDGLQALTPSYAVTAEHERLGTLIRAIREFIEDIKAPADMYLIDSDFRSGKDVY